MASTGDDKTVAKILKEADSVKLREEMEEIGGFSCYVLEGETAYGIYKIWVDPSFGFSIRKAIVHKRAGDISFGKPIPEDALPKQIEISDVHITKVGNWCFPISETITKTITTNEGAEEQTRYVTRRSGVQVNPDFEKFGAFLMDKIPDGTQVNNYGPQDFGYGYELRDGKVKPIGGESGRTVIGRIMPPSNDTAEKSWLDNISSHIRTAEYRSNIHIGRDGSFRVENVPPGSHELVVRITEAMPDKPRMRRIIGEAAHEFRIDEKAGDINEPLDVGALRIKLYARLNPSDQAPLFEVQAIDGKPLKLSGYRGKVVLLHFWATWCRLCIAEMPKIKEVYELFNRDKHFVMIGLSRDKEKDALKNYIEKNQIRWPQAWLGQTPKPSIMYDYGIYGIPAVFLVGRDGKVVSTDRDYDKLKIAVAKALVNIAKSKP